METTPYQRLEMFWLSKGIKNASGFAEHIGVKPATISAIKQRSSTPSSKVLKAIQQKFPDVNPDYIQWGQGPMLRDGKELTRLPADPAPATPTAGHLAVVSESEQVKELKEQVRELREHNRLLTELLRSGIDISKLTGSTAVGSFKLDEALAVVEARPSMRIAA